MRWLLILIILAGGGLMLVRWFLRTPAPDVARALRRWGGLAFIAGGIVLFLLGQVALALPLLMLGFASLAGRGLPLGGKPSSGGRSSVRGRLVVMELDHDTGEVDGEVIAGQFHGRWLSALSVEEILVLLGEAEREDAQSASLIAAYLDQAHPDWREKAGSGEKGSSARGHGAADMSRAEALDILGLEEGADEKAIKAAYTRLMKRFHPDQGGSTYFATRLNEAKDLLLKRKKT